MSQPVHVTVIHGLGNKPAARELRRIWLEALAAPVEGDDGFDLGAVGVTDSFVYWADLFNDEPMSATGYESRSDELADSIPEAIELDSDAWTRAMLLKFPDDDETAFEEAPVDDDTEEYERIPIPWFLKRRIMRCIVKEAHDYLFNVDGVRDTIRERVVQDLNTVPEGARQVLVGHSQGSFIAYDALTGVPDCRDIEGFLTFGSPLGIDEVQDKLVWTREDGFPRILRGEWVNVYDPFDVVARLDPRLANDFKKNGEELVIDVKEENWGTSRHSTTKYLKGPKLRSHLRRLCDREGT